MSNKHSGQFAQFRTQVIYTSLVAGNNISYSTLQLSVLLVPIYYITQNNPVNTYFSVDLAIFYVIIVFINKGATMQYILTQEELEALKQQASNEGFRRAEQILSETLAGKDVQISINIHGKLVSVFDDVNKENVWRKLVDLAGVVPAVVKAEEEIPF